MEVLAVGKYIRISPKKAREVADLVRGKNARVSQETLKCMPHKAAEIIGKVLGSAMANAENNFNLDKDQLVISRITIDGGPALKRWLAGARGAAKPIKKRTSHITVIVSGDVKTKRVQEAKKEEKKEIQEEVKEAKGAHEIVRKENVKQANVSNKIFRRKTG